MLTILIPTKTFSEAKTRLTPVLSPEQRQQLSWRLFMHTVLVALPVARNHKGRVVVVSRGREVLALAQQLGAVALREEASDLNQAIQQGMDWGLRRGSRRCLVLPADLPLLSYPALSDLLETHPPGSGSQIVLVPCQRYSGTNALLLSPVNLISPQFGLNSLQKHQLAALACDLTASLYHSPELAFDLDTPQDWQRLVAHTAHAAQFDVLA